MLDATHAVTVGKLACHVIAQCKLLQDVAKIMSSQEVVIIACDFPLPHDVTITVQ